MKRHILVYIDIGGVKLVFEYPTMVLWSGSVTRKVERFSYADRLGLCTRLKKPEDLQR
jgi:hypothetical protein